MVSGITMALLHTRQTFEWHGFSHNSVRLVTLIAASDMGGPIFQATKESCTVSLTRLTMKGFAALVRGGSVKTQMAKLIKAQKIS